MSARRKILARLFFIAPILLAACDDGDDPAEQVAGDAAASDAATPPGDGSANDDAAVPPADLGPETDGGAGGSADAGPPPVDDCDPLIPEACALPWPSNHYLVADPAMPTGERLQFGATSLPAPRSGHHPDPAIFAHLDGFGVGTPIITLFPEMDGATLPGEAAIEASLAEDAQILLFEVGAEGLHRLPYFAELDQRVEDGAQPLLFVRPAVLLREGTRHIAVFRDLKRHDGSAVPPSPAFAALRDGTAAADPALAPRVERFERMFGELAAAGIPRAGLTLAWDWTTASCEKLHGPLLHMREDALGRLAAQPPEIVFDQVETLTPEQAPLIALEISGHVSLPYYLDPLGPYLNWTGWQLRRDADGLPEYTGQVDVPFLMRVPRSALDGTPHGILAFGHGLNGTFGQLRGDETAQVASDGHYVAWGWNMAGMTHDDVTGIISLLTDLGYLPWLTDRLHQGILNGVMLARVFAEGLGARLADQGVVIDGTRSVYEGHSQGGIYGATVVAVSPDIQRGWLGVPGVNYSTLLERSVDFSPFLIGLSSTYRTRFEQAVALGMVQVLWDAVDPVSHYRHLSLEPFLGDPPNAVLAGTAEGDWQVSPLTMESVARSGVGVPLMAPYDDVRTVPLAETATYPRTGSGVVSWDLDGEWPPPGNLTPPETAAGDPHGRPRNNPDHQRQVVHFFETGEIIDVCAGQPCPAAP